MDIHITGSLIKKGAAAKQCTLSNTQADYTPEGNESLASAATRALKCGISVVPCVNGEKRPAGNWKQFQQQLPSPESIQRWGESVDKFGFVTGEISGGLEGLDFDTSDAWMSFELLAKKSGLSELLSKVVNGYEEKSPHGVHLLYRCEDISGNQKLARCLDTSTGEIKTLIETRGEGGFLVVAPSVGYELESGSYEDIAVISPEERMQLLALSKSLNEMEPLEPDHQGSRNRSIDRPGDKYRADNSWADILEPEGWTYVSESKDIQYWRRPGKDDGVSASTRENGGLYVFSTSTTFPSEESISKFHAYAYINHKGDIHEAVKNLAEYYGMGAVSSTSSEPPEPLPESTLTADGEPFPMEAIPESVRQAAAEVARFSKVPYVSPVVVGISTLALSIGKKAFVVEREGHWHHPALFFAIIAASGERKSPVFRAMTSPIDGYIKEQGVLYKEETSQSETHNDLIDSQISFLKNSAKKTPDADIQDITESIQSLEKSKRGIAPFPSMYTTDATEERLFQKMHERGGAYGVMSGEGRQVIDAIKGKHSGDGNTGDGIYLAGISGDTVTRDRVGSNNGAEERVIQHPCMNVCIMVQPDKYLSLAAHPSLRSSGAIARIWSVWAPSLVGSRIEEPGESGLDMMEMKLFTYTVNFILNFEPLLDEHGELTPHRAILSEEAAEARRLYHNSIELRMASDSDLSDVRDIASKAVSQVCKLALVFHVSDNPALLNCMESKISHDTWQQAEKVGDHFLQEAIRSQRGADEDSSMQKARKILEWLRIKDLREVSRTAFSQLSPRPRPKKQELQDVLNILMTEPHHWLTPIEGKKGWYTVHDSLFSPISQNSQGIT